MSAFVVVDLTPKDGEKLKEYAATAGATVAAHGGEFLAKGEPEVLNGGKPFAMKAIIKFADKDAANKWYNSAEYQALIATRDAGMESQFHLIG